VRVRRVRHHGREEPQDVDAFRAVSRQDLIAEVVERRLDIVGVAGVGLQLLAQRGHRRVEATRFDLEQRVARGEARHLVVGELPALERVVDRRIE